MRKKVQWLHINCMSALDKGLCLVLLSQTGPVPQVALRPLLEGGQGSEHWNPRAKERRVSRSARQGRVVRKELMVGYIQS